MNKTIGEIRREMNANNDHGRVMTTLNFIREIMEGYIIEYDGDGCFHDGQIKTDISVWDNLCLEDLRKYPYVIWYNR